ncbi:hypothetical protein, partial [Streptomyces cyaneofuscatus]|uniref:hypothetical protein n=1 Tax=Streptomyces cyaneofuscatus TaxID=66883 RepID=UPI003648AB6F
GMLNPYTYATGDPVNHTDPTGQSPEDAWNWFNDNILSWEGAPYIEVGLAVAGVVAAATGGVGIPLALAVVGAAATLPAAADQIMIHSTGKGYMSEDVRLAANVVGIVSGGAEGGYAAIKGINKIRSVVKGASHAAPAGPAAVTPLALPPPTFNGDDIVKTFTDANEAGLINPQLARAVNVPDFRQAYGDGRLDEFGGQAHATFKAELTGAEKPISTQLLEPMVVPYEAGRHSTIKIVEETRAYLGARIAGEGAGAGDEFVLGSLTPMQNALGDAVSRLYVNAGVTDWTRFVSESGEVVLDNGGAVRGIKGILELS